MSDQLIFDFFDQKNCDNFKESDYVFSSHNENANKFLSRFFSQSDSTENPIYSMILMGNSQSGKTHLLNIFAKKYNTTIIPNSDLKENSWSNFFTKNHFYIIENIDEIRNDEMIFHILNSALENKAFLVLSTKTINNFHLKDLISRIKNIPIITINKPEEETIKMLLLARLAKRQLKVKDEVLDYLAIHLRNDYQAISDSLKLFEFFVSENKKDLNLIEAKKLFKDLVK